MKSGGFLNIKRNWAGVACCFLLFTVVCLVLANVKGAFRSSGHPELGLLFFILPGIVASFLTRGEAVFKSLIGAVLAAPLCLVVMRWVFVPSRSLWQELAWLMSGIFWCALGALCFLFARSLIQRLRHK
jgi:Putative inner membrane protein of Enterobacteriaceae.